MVLWSTCWGCAARCRCLQGGACTRHAGQKPAGPGIEPPSLQTRALRKKTAAGSRCGSRAVQRSKQLLESWQGNNVSLEMLTVSFSRHVVVIHWRCLHGIQLCSGKSSVWTVALAAGTSAASLAAAAKKTVRQQYPSGLLRTLHQSVPHQLNTMHTCHMQTLCQQWVSRVKCARMLALAALC